MTRIARLVDRLPILYRPEPGDRDLLPRLLEAVAAVMEDASIDASDVLQSRWWAYADRAAYHPFFVLSKRLDSELDGEDFHYIHDLARVAAILPLTPREEPPAHRDTVETFRLRVARMVDLYRGGLGTLDAVRRMVEIELPLVPDVPLERRDRPFLLEEFTPGPESLDASPDGSPAGSDLLGPMMRFTVTNAGIEARPPTVYIEGVAAQPDVTDATVSPVLELYRVDDAFPRVAIAFDGTVADGEVLRIRPSYSSWIGGDAGVRRADAVPVDDAPPDPTAPGPWTVDATGPTDEVTALARGEDHALWAATRAADVGSVHRFDGTAWTAEITGLPVVHDMLEDGAALLLGTEDGVLRVETHPAGGGPLVADPVPGLDTSPARALLRDSDGSVWVASDGVLLRRPASGPIESFAFDDGDGAPIPLNALARDGDRGLLIGCALGLILYSPTRGDWFWYGGEAFTEQVEHWHRVEPTTEPDGLPTDATVFLPPVNALLRGPDASIWLGTEDGVARYLASRPPTPSGLEREVGLVFQAQIEAFPDLAPGRARAIETDARGVVWFATDLGLHRFDGRDWWQHQDADGWVQMGRADMLYPAGRDAEPRGAWRFDRGAARWQHFDTGRSDWSDFTEAPRGTEESAATALLWTDGAVGELGSWSGDEFVPTGPVPDGSLRMRYKPTEDRIADGGIVAVPRLPPGASVWRYLSLEAGAAGPGRSTPWWTREGRLMPPTIADFTLDEAPPPGRHDREVPAPPSDWDNSVYAYLPAAGVRFEWATRRPRRVLVRLLTVPDVEPLDPAILDRVWSGMLKVRPAGVWAALAIDELIVRQSNGDG